MACSTVFNMLFAIAQTKWSSYNGCTELHNLAIIICSLGYFCTTGPIKFITVSAQLKKVCSLTHGVLLLKCDLIQNKLKVEQIVHSWEPYTVYNFSVCVCKLFCTVSIPKVLTVNNIWLFFLLRITLCVLLNTTAAMKTAALTGWINFTK